MNIPKPSASLVLKVGKVGEHPLSIIYALNEAMDSHGAVMVLSFGLFATGVMALVWDKVHVS